MKYRIWSQTGDYGLVTKLGITVENPDGSRGVARPLVFDAVQDRFDLPACTMESRSSDIKDLLQAFLDHAWECGLRPTGFVGTEQVKALKAHLADMRAIAFSRVDLTDEAKIERSA